MKNIHFLLLGILLFTITSCTNRTVSVETLLDEMVNREALARYPNPEYTCAQFSSYDRATVDPNQKSWFANWDRSMFINIEEKSGRKEYVMMDTTGPGAIVRFWMTFAGDDCGKGILRIYIDNDSIPAIEGAAMDILSGGQLVAAPLAASVSELTKYEMRGHNLYLPIPYAKHCKVTYQSDNIKDAGAKTGGEAVYYNINYRTYHSNAKVISYSSKELEKAGNTLQNVQRKLAELDRELPSNTEKQSLVGVIKPNDTLSIQVQGEKAIRKLSFKLSAGNLPQALRSTIMLITYDNGEASASVQSPIGDFFGTGYQIRTVDTWYTQVTNDGVLSAWWVMPFKENCKIALVNIGKQEVKIEQGDVETSSWDWDSQSMYFGTYWSEHYKLKTGEMKNNEGDGNPFDMNYVTLQGKGIYVGDALTMFNTVYAWWGEGDEKIYVDGEKFPSHIGTGTEDYYGYAWCRPEEIIRHPFIAQPDGSGNFYPGYTVNSRYRSLDGIPFTSKLVFDMEMWHWTRALVNVSPVCFYYLKEGTDPNSNYKISKVGKVAIKRQDIISPSIEYILTPQKHAYLQAESMILSEVTGGHFRYQNSVKYGWGDNMQVYWSDGKVGDKLRLTFIAPDNESMPVKATFTTAPDYGKFKFKVNDKLTTLNLNSNEIALKTFDLGVVQLNKGENTIEVEIIGTAPNDKKTTIFGFDQLLFGTK